MTSPTTPTPAPNPSPNPAQNPSPNPAPTPRHQARNASRSQPRAVAGRREWIGLTVLLLAALLANMDVSVLYFAVPFIARKLEPSATQQLWIFDVYGFVLAGLLITMGSLGDRIGRRRLLFIGAAAFSLASLAAAYAHTAGELIAARALLGVAGATLMPSTLALIRNMFHDEKQRRTAVAIWTGGAVGGIALGPVISGVLLEHFWWGSVFLINIPFMVLLLALGPFLIPEYRTPQAGRFDLLSSLLSLGAILPAIYGVKEIAANGFAPSRALWIAAGLAVGALFVLRQRRADHPMIDLSLFRSRGFTGSVLMNMVSMLALVGFAMFSTQYLQSVLGMSPLKAALWALVPSVAVGAVAPVTAQLVQHFDRAYVAAAGFAVCAAGFALLTRVQADSRLWVVLVGACVYAAGTVMVMAVGSELILGAVPPERAGSAAAVSETGTEFGGAFGLAVLGSVGTAIYRSWLGSHAPAGISPTGLQTARQTLGGALVVAQQTPGAAGANLLSAARTAFVHGMNAAAAGAGVIALVGAVLTVLFLRGLRIETADSGGETKNTHESAKESTQESAEESAEQSADESATADPAGRASAAATAGR